MPTFSQKLLSAFVLAAALGSPLALADPPQRPFAIAFSALGPEADSVDGSLAAGFCESLAGRPGFQAKVVANKSGYWMSFPKTTESEKLTVVAMAVGEHRDLVGMVWDEKGTTVLAAARRQFRALAKGRRDWYGPGPWQIGDNAVKELAQDIAHVFKPGTSVRDDRRVQVTVASWNVTAADLTTGIDSLVKEKSGGEPERPVAAGIPSVDGVKALTFAALSEAGFQASSEAAPITLNIELAQATDHYAFRCTLSRGGKQERYQRRHVPRAELYDYLVTASRKLLTWDAGVRDSARFGLQPVQPMAVGKDLIVLSAGENLIGVDPLTGAQQYTIEAAPKTSPRYQQWPTPAGTKTLCFNRDSSQIDPATGKGSTIGTILPASPNAIDFSGERFTVIRDTAAALYIDGKEQWKTTFAETLVAGPAILGDQVIVGNDSGELLALSAADGKERWRKPMPVRLRGVIGAVDGLAIVGSMEGQTLAVKPDGSIAWQQAARDLPLTRPVMVDGLIFYADKGDTLWLTDPKTGAVRASFESPTWLRGAAIIENDGRKWAVVSDRQGAVRFLSLPDLKPVRELRLASDLTGAMAVSPKLPVTWASHDDLDQKAPGLLVGSTDGWLYLLDLPGK